MELVFSLDQIEAAAKSCWEAAGAAKVFAFHGQMGAGKTTFIAALCKLKGISSASSPTFSIINEYQSSSCESIYHLDLYRLKDEQEAIQAGVEDVLNSGNICLVEWPEQASGLLPIKTVHCYLELASASSRKLIIKGN